MLDTTTMVALVKNLDGAAARQRAIASNVANIDTPNYKRLVVQFEDQLRKALMDKGELALWTTHPGHISNLPELGQISPKVLRDESTTMRTDGNNVDIEQEMIELAANTLNYQISSQQLNTRLAMLRYAINEGRR